MEVCKSHSLFQPRCKARTLAVNSHISITQTFQSAFNLVWGACPLPAFAPVSAKPLVSRCLYLVTLLSQGRGRRSHVVWAAIPHMVFHAVPSAAIPQFTLKWQEPTYSTAHCCLAMTPVFSRLTCLPTQQCLKPPSPQPPAEVQVPLACLARNNPEQRTWLVGCMAPAERTRGLRALPCKPFLKAPTPASTAWRSNTKTHHGLLQSTFSPANTARQTVLPERRKERRILSDLPLTWTGIQRQRD